MARRVFELQQDRRGLWWDLMLYVPTVGALTGLAAMLWYQGNPDASYLLAFLGCFFLFAGANRILKTRLMLLPTAPIAIETDPQEKLASLLLRNGQRIDLLKDVKVFKDYSGRTFGLVGFDSGGRRQQFVFHKGQFSFEKDYLAIQQPFVPPPLKS